MVNSSDVKLLGVWSSPFVLRARIALHLKSVQYQYLEDNLASKSELLLKSNPVHKKIPVLIHGDKAVCESLTIVQYVDESWPSDPPILPSDPHDRAVARFWAGYVDAVWFPSIDGIGSAKDEETKKACMRKVEEGLVLLEEAFVKCSKGKAFFGGDQIGYIDIAIGSYLAALNAVQKVFGINLLREDKTPSLVKWVHSFCSHDAVKSFMPDTDKLVEFVMSHYNN